MPPRHTVEQGESIASIALRYKQQASVIWDHADNAALKKLRGDPNVLHVGDVVVIPDKKKQYRDCASGQTHRFVRKEALVPFCLQMCDDDEPRANVKYTLEVDGKQRTGSTDGQGYVKEKVPADAKRGVLTLEDDDPVAVTFGHLDPQETVTGVQGRLRNLGYDCGPADGELGPRTKAALEQFQRDYGLEVTGAADASTAQRLQEVHGS